MSSITKRQQKLSVQRNQYITPSRGFVHSRAIDRACGIRQPYSAAEIRAERLYYAEQDRLYRVADQQSRKTQRSVLRQQRMSAAG